MCQRNIEFGVLKSPVAVKRVIKMIFRLNLRYAKGIWSSVSGKTLKKILWIIRMRCAIG